MPGDSVRLVRDQIEADLVRRLKRVDSALLAIVLRQVGLAHDITAAIAQHIAALRAGRPNDGKRLAARAGLIERKADRIALEARNEASRLNAGPIIEQLVDRVEELVDELEQAAFIASLAPAGIDPAAAFDTCRIMRGRHDGDRSRSLGACRRGRSSGRTPRRYRGRSQRRHPPDRRRAPRGRRGNAMSPHGCSPAASTCRRRFPCSSLPAPSSAPPTDWPASDICCGGTS